VGKAKALRVEPISRRAADGVIKRLHYSGRVVRNSQLHLGVFYEGRLEGALQFGPSLDKSNIVRLVEGTSWNGFLELNRMAFSDALPRNSESRAISVSMRLIRQHYQHIEWVVSFADGTQCGDGTIYRASGFALTGIQKNKSLCRLPGGRIIHEMTLKSNPNAPMPELNGRSFYDLTDGANSFPRFVKGAKAEVLVGFQLRYMYFINPAARERLTVPVLPYEEIDKRGAGMYLGEKR
jgi:hypothetical protein